MFLTWSYLEFRDDFKRGRKLFKRGKKLVQASARRKSGHFCGGSKNCKQTGCCWQGARENNIKTASRPAEITGSKAELLFGFGAK